MTCIIGFAHQNRVWLGGDSAGVSGYHIQIRSDSKVFHNGPYMIGFTSSFRMGQLLRYHLVPPAHPKNMDDMRYMVTEFIKAVRTVLADGGFVQKQNGVEQGGAFLVGYKGNLYEVDSDFQIGQTHENISAVGCGAHVALGAMYSLAHLEPQERILRSLEITEKLNSGVRGPFTVLEKNYLK